MMSYALSIPNGSVGARVIEVGAGMTSQLTTSQIQNSMSFWGVPWRGTSDTKIIRNYGNYGSNSISYGIHVENPGDLLAIGNGTIVSVEGRHVVIRYNLDEQEILSESVRAEMLKHVNLLMNTGASEGRVGVGGTVHNRATRDNTMWCGRVSVSSDSRHVNCCGGTTPSRSPLRDSYDALFGNSVVAGYIKLAQIQRSGSLVVEYFNNIHRDAPRFFTQDPTSEAVIVVIAMLNVGPNGLGRTDTAAALPKLLDLEKATGTQVRDWFVNERHYWNSSERGPYTEHIRKSLESIENPGDLKVPTWDAVNNFVLQGGDVLIGDGDIQNFFRAAVNAIYAGEIGRSEGIEAILRAPAFPATEVRTGDEPRNPFYYLNHHDGVNGYSFGINQFNNNWQAGLVWRLVRDYIEAGGAGNAGASPLYIRYSFDTGTIASGLAVDSTVSKGQTLFTGVPLVAISSYFLDTRFSYDERVWAPSNLQNSHLVCLFREVLVIGNSSAWKNTYGAELKFCSTFLEGYADVSEDRKQWNKANSTCPEQWN
jgi:hypothetical protein